MKHTNRRLLAMLLALVMSVACLVSPAMANPAEAHSHETSTNAFKVEEQYVTPDGETLTVPTQKDTTETRIMVAVEDGMTTFLETSDLELAVAAADEQKAEYYAAESAIATALGEEIEIDRYFSLVFNGFSFTGESWMIDAINEIDGLTAMEVMEFQLVEPEDEDTSIDLTPSMATSTSMTGATIAWDLGYTGEGMVVGVIDTGIKQTHEAFNVMPEGAKIDQKYLEDIFAKYGSLMHGQNPEGAYYNAKMPYNWDYWDDDHIPNHTNSNHGSHVAGIVAGNNGADFKGVAPDAQIISLQVFNSGGGAAVDDMLAAMEDAVYLGVDAINMSLGIANGFETYSWPMDFAPVYEALEKAGVAVCVAAGNDAHAYISTMFGNWNNYVWQWSSLNPDNSLMGTPGTYVGSFTVGNTTNLARTGGGCTIYYKGVALNVTPTFATTEGQLFFDAIPAGVYDLVNCGSGSADEIAAAGDVTGKILLMQKTGYSTKIKSAVSAGAAGVLFYDHLNTGIGSFNPSSKKIPVGIISYEDGTAIITDMGSGNVVQITLKTGGGTVDYSKVTMVDSSSWGPNVTLTMKPDIAAPGNSILSVDGTATKEDNAYSKKTGTSMATPAIAGGVLLMKQHLKTMFPEATATELTELAYAFMMSTAGMASAFVRQQGAGVMDLDNATKTKAYLTTTENTRPKLELDDSATGEFDISFQVHNVDTIDKTYRIGYAALTEKTFTMEYEGYHSSRQPIRKWQTAELSKRWGYWLVNPTPETVTLCDGTLMNVAQWCTLEGERDITVKAGETLTVNLTLKAGPELLAYFAENCPDGMYLEGWFKLIDKSSANVVDLSIPYLGFVGDWDYPAVIDDGWWWQDEFGVNNMAQMYNSNINGGVFLGYGDAEQGMGLNYYWDATGETYLADRNAISPNDDGMLDAITTLEFSLLRQPRRVRMYIEYEDGTILPIYDKSYSFRKETHPVGMATSGGGLGYSGLYWDYRADELEENETATYVVEAYLDRDEFTLEGNKRAVLEIPFYKDTTAPVVTAIDGGVEILDANYVAYYAIYTDARHTNLVFEDGVFAMERGVKETYKTDLNKYFVAVADYARNEAFYYVEDGVAYKLDGEGFDHGRTIMGETWRTYAGQSDYENTFAWYSINENLDRMPKQLTPITNTSDDLEAGIAASDIVAVGKAANGTVYASSLGGLYTFNPETLEKDLIARYSYEGERVSAMLAFDVAPGTNELYGVISHSGNAMSKCYFVSIDPETAELTHLWEIKFSRYKYAFDFYDSDTIIMKQMYSKSEMGFELINVDGTSEGIIDKGWAIKNSSGGNAKTTLGGHVGYASSLLYDGDNNVVYMGGSWSYSYDDRGYTHVVAKVDLETGNVSYMQTGMNGGIGLMSLYFLEDVMDVPEQEHITYIKEVVEGDCLTEGYTLRVCAECGKEFKENVTEAKGHDYEAVVTAPTCTTLGYTTYTCKVCGDSYKDDYTPNTDHVYGEWETVTAPTCNAKGQEKRTCVCGAAEYRDTDKTGHNYESVVTAPTCTTLGYTTYTCTVCGDTYKSDFVETIGHKYTEEVVAPTCTDMGYTIFTCHCGHRYEGNFVAPTGHKFGEWTVTKEATCVENGEETRTCACGETETRSTFKADHKYEATVIEPTCTEVGYTNHICTVCGHNYITDLTQPTGHDYEATVTAPTCTEDGYTTYTCTVCGESYVDDIVPATGHTFGEWVLTTEPGCTEAGEETRYCADCDATETREVAPVCPAEKFSDVDTKQWYHEGVCYVIRNGLMNGKSETVFAPNANLTRAELVTVLYRMAGEPSVEDLEHPFADVADDTWYTDAVIWAYNAEVVKGISNTAFAPNANITREQIATILYRYAGAEEVEEDALADFADADKVNNYAVDAMNWAVSVGLINGMDDATLAPQGNATRAQIATILMRYCEG
ncbi:MAG: hypothetical protein E7459_06405 [Ruminococcaceae bacterium]|nr:hypothetical protein [Oscillospiraceae bacterium]